MGKIEERERKIKMKDEKRNKDLEYMKEKGEEEYN